ncbi:hypothetical protein WP8S18E11_07170 [Aeromonas veronii]|nr:hypothetical protein WP8S18E11_07170 [Aeromonas veronii]
MQAFFVWPATTRLQIFLTNSPAQIKKFILYMG